MKNEPESLFEGIVKLWILRMFTAGKGRFLLVGKHRINDDELADYIGLVEEEDDDEEYQQRILLRKLKSLWQSCEDNPDKGRWPSHIENNLKQIAGMLGLNKVEWHILGLLAMKYHHDVMEDAFRLFKFSGPHQWSKILARILSVPVDDIKFALAPNSQLISSGLAKFDRHGCSGWNLSIFDDDLAEFLFREDFTLEKALRIIASPAPPPTLRFSDYPQLKELLETLRPFLRSVVKEKTRGVNIYIYGAPGTGKSELVRVLSRELRAELYEVSCEDKDGDPFTGNSRMISMRMAQSLLKDQRAILAFDEAEDIFAPSSIFHRSLADERKGWLNRSLENNPIPTFWISNRVSGVDPAFVRRFDFIFELKGPPQKQRLSTLKRICKDSSLHTVRKLADCEDLTPAVAARAYAVSRRAHPVENQGTCDKAMLSLIQQTMQAQGYTVDLTSSDKSSDRLNYSTQFVNTGISLQSIADQLRERPSCRICLYGPPGTGKSRFGNWLAKELNQSLIVKRASDILGPYMGETEQKLASIFNQAQSAKSILMIDEVDGFLQNRSHAQRSWEVTQVNELLTQMEQFNGVFIASTNLMEGLEPAAFRRFDLKIYFDYLAAQQAAALLQRQMKVLGLMPPTKRDTRRLGEISVLTPGDFANVARQARFRGITGAAGFIDLLEKECSFKKEGSKPQIGFHIA